MATAASRWQPPRAPPAAAGTRCGSPRPPGGRRLGTAARPESRSAPSGVGGPRGAALRPLPTPTQPPRDWERKGEARPRPRTAPSGLEAVLEGGGIQGGGNAIAFPHPKHGRCPPPAGGGRGFRIRGAQSGRPTEETLARGIAETPALPPPRSGSWRGDPGRGPAPKLAPIPSSRKEGIPRRWRLPS